jgi:hypothetical protein
MLQRLGDVIDRHHDRERDRPHGAAHAEHHDRLDERRQPLQGMIQFTVEDACGSRQSATKIAGGFTGGDQAALM